MKNFKFSKETINAIINHISNTEIDGCVVTEDAEFEQDGCLIIVNYEVYGNWEEDYNVHNEFGYNNIEDLSHWEYEGASIIGITVSNDEEDEIPYDQSAIKTIENGIAA